MRRSYRQLYCSWIQGWTGGADLFHYQELGKHEKCSLRRWIGEEDCCSGPQQTAGMMYLQERNHRHRLTVNSGISRRLSQSLDYKVMQTCIVLECLQFWLQQHNFGFESRNSSILILAKFRLIVCWKFLYKVLLFWMWNRPQDYWTYFL